MQRSVVGNPDFRKVLKSEFESRAQGNPLYSLRAFARDLRLSPATLSEILNGKQGLSRTKAGVICDRLGYSKQEKDYFCDLVDSHHARGKIKRSLASTRLKRYVDPKFNELKEDTLRIISDWYHFAILELTYLEGFQSNHLWIAKSLGISKIEAKNAVERLFALKLLKDEDGRWTDANLKLATTDGVPSSAIRELHCQLLARATQALASQTVDERDSSAMIFAVDRSDLPTLKEKLRDFRRDLARSARGAKKKDSVYCLSMQLFNLNQNEGNSL